MRSKIIRNSKVKIAERQKALNEKNYLDLIDYFHELRHKGIINREINLLQFSDQKPIDIGMLEELVKLVSLAENLEKRQNEIAIQEKVIAQFLDAVYRIYCQNQSDFSKECQKVMYKFYASKREKIKKSAKKAQATKMRKKLLAQNNTEMNQTADN